MSEIYLAGGCFWGAERYLKLIHGVLSTQVGYANGDTEAPTYEDVCYRNTGHAETVKVEYDSNLLSLDFLLHLFYEAIDPTTLNRQGGDTGVQYRTGIYYTNANDLSVIKLSINHLQKQYKEPIVIEILPLLNFTLAEDYHQDYLVRNPSGYCHIGRDQFEKASRALINPTDFDRKNSVELQDTLTDIQYKVTQNNATEPPFDNAYYDHKKEGIYVDITTGEPLFASTDKFDSGCGWPSFSKPIDPFVLKEKKDVTHGMARTEVRSRVGDAHMGHVFEDGPKASGGLRYCINSASLRFIPKEDLESEGYGYLIDIVK